MAFVYSKLRAGVPAAALMLLVLGTQRSLASPPPPTQPPPPVPIVVAPGGLISTPPILLSLSSQQVPGQKFRIYGRVADANPANCGVVITGAATGVATCDANGYFDAIFNVATPGAIQAVVGNGQAQSAPSAGMLTNAGPAVAGLTAVQGAGNTWTFSGTVTDEAPAGLTVTLTGPPGVNGATATVGANGSWSVTLTLPEGTSGNLTATVTDWYGLQGFGYTSF